VRAVVGAERAGALLSGFFAERRGG
jgi:hypothetical protein